jgi:hypothetical protein
VQVPITLVTTFGHAMEKSLRPKNLAARKPLLRIVPVFVQEDSLQSFSFLDARTRSRLSLLIIQTKKILAAVVAG